MKIKLPGLGQIKTGKDAQEIVSVATIEHPPQIDKTYDILGGLLSVNQSSSLSNEKSISRKLLEANKEWVYRNSDVIAQEVSNIEFELFSIDLKGGEIEFNQIEDHPLLDLLDKFNSRTTKSDGIYMTESHKKLTGDSFWLLDKNGDSVQNIFILPPDKVEIMLADPTDASADLVKGYIYRDVIDGKKIEKSYTPEEIIHFKKPNPKNPFRGYGAVEAISDTIDSDNLTNEVQRQFFEKGAISNFVLTTDSNITPEQLKRLRAEMRAMYGGAKNAFNTMIFGNGLKPADIGFSNKDMEFLALLEWYRDKIMVGFGNTKASIGIIDDVNRASFEGSLAGWLRSTIKPDMNAIVQTVNEFLVPIYGDSLILGYKDPIPQNVTEDSDRAVLLKESGIIQINEAREMVGISPIDGGDVFAPKGQGPNSPNGNEQNPNAPKPADQNQDEQKATWKKLRTIDKKELPASLSHFDIQPVLRNRNIYFKKRLNKQLKEEALPVIRAMVNKNKKKIKKDEPKQFTEQQINDYYAKQINLVEAFEHQFHDKVLQLLDKVREQALANFEHEIQTMRSLKSFVKKKKELFDAEDTKVQAQLDLTPILMQEAALAGQEAIRLVNSEETYIPFKIQDSVRTMVDKFADSMTSTDKDKLTGILENGIEAGDSIADIRDKINLEFGDYTKVQAERITRTEVLRASSMAAEDAFIQSGVVVAKQWLVALDPCKICEPYAGKIVKLNKDFYSPDDSGFQNGNPPKHVNCRCQLIPIVMGAEAYQPDFAKTVEEQRKYITDLEAQVDKRTKAYKDLKSQKLDDEVYIKALEKHLSIDGNE